MHFHNAGVKHRGCGWAKPDLQKTIKTWRSLRWFPMVFGIFTISDGWFWHHFTFFSHLSLWCFRPCFLPRTPTDNSPSYYSVHHGVNDIEATWTTQIYRKRNWLELTSWKILKGKSGWQKCETQELVVFPCFSMFSFGRCGPKLPRNAKACV